ncbi:MAG: oligosaccharide flippase family protein [bacterium]|nr:oligosaccharide flippase family protein [bacterium]
MLNSSLYIFGSKLVGYAIRLVLPFFLIRLLSVSDFGAYRQFFLLESYIGALFQLGLNQALYYLIPRDLQNAGSYFLNSVLMNVLVFAIAFSVIWFALDPLSDALNMAVLRDAFWTLAIYVVALMLTVGCDCYLTARQCIKAAAAFEVGGQIVVSALSVMVAYFTRDLQLVLTSLVVGRSLQLLAMISYIHWRLHGFRSERYFFGIREQVRYSVVLGAGGTLITMVMRLHEFVVSRYYGPEGYAVYSAGCTELPVIQMFTQSVAVVALGQFAVLEQKKDWEGIRQLWRRVLTSSYAVAIPITLILVVAAKPIIIFMCTDVYADAAPIFRVNSLIKLGLIFNYTLVLRAMSRNDITMWINVVALVAAPFLLYAGMKMGGMLGVIEVQALLMIGTRLLGTFLMNRIIPAPLPYLVSVKEVGGFYREVFDKGRTMLGAFGRR